MSLLGEGANGGASGGASGGGSAPGGGDPAAAAGDPAKSGAAASGNSPASWRESLADDLKAEGSLANFKDVNDLAKSYVHAQKQMGKKGLIPPTEKSSDEEWAHFYKQLGLPELDKYSVDPKDIKVPEEAMKAFKETAHKMGLLPKQAQGVFEWITGQEKASLEAKKAAYAASKTAAIDGLKKEWGQGYDKELAAARLAVEKFGGPEFQTYMNESGMGDDPNLVRFMAKLGKTVLAEDTIRGAANGSMGNTPEELKAKIEDIYGNKAHPYWDKNHPGHQRAVQEMEGYQQKMYG